MMWLPNTAGYEQPKTFDMFIKHFVFVGRRECSWCKGTGVEWTHDGVNVESMKCRYCGEYAADGGRKDE